MKEDLSTVDIDLEPLPPARTTLPGVILKVKEIARSKYNNKLYDHILSVYGELETSEKRILLKGLIGICYMVEDRILIDSVSMNEIKTQVKKVGQDVKNTIHSEFGDIEKINKIELIKLKSWMIKAGSLTVLVGLIGVLIMIVFLNQDSSSGILAGLGFIEKISEVLKTALGL